MPPQQRAFRLDGSVSLFVPVVALEKGGSGSAHKPVRRMAGWLTTYGKLADDGTVIPTRDREDQVMDAAKTARDIDWTDYIRGGLWNDHHRAFLPNGEWPPNAPGERGVEVFVGVPTALDFHDGTTPLSQAHGKVGFFTTGHLFDRSDPASWELYTDYQPNDVDLARADALWEIAQMLDGTDGSLGLSAHGVATLSRCGRSIIWAKIAQGAVVTGPCNPDATLDLVKGAQDVLSVLGKARPATMVAPCGRCTCPKGTCANTSLAKAVTAPVPDSPMSGGVSSDTLAAIVPEDLEGVETTEAEAPRLKEIREYLLTRIQQLFGCDDATAERWLSDHPYIEASA